MPKLKTTHVHPTPEEDAAITAAADRDSDNPEWTKADFAASRPSEEVLPGIVKRARGERGPQKAPTKVPVKLRLDPDIVERFKAGGKGWQTRMNDVLRAYAPPKDRKRAGE